MKKKQKIIIVGLVILALIVIGIVFIVRPSNEDSSSGECSARDRELNNCVPAGRCTPPGDPREATINCIITDYDRKFNSEL